jgi:hypothetical protein
VVGEVTDDPEDASQVVARGRQRDRANEVLLRDPALLHAPVRPYTEYPGGHNEGFADTFKQLFRVFYDYGETGERSGRAGSRVRAASGGRG